MKITFPVTFEAIWERFWSRVSVEADDECWEWDEGRDSYGYGTFRMSGQLEKAHRMSWCFLESDIPEGMGVLHSCDNPPCVNPAHLFLGTQISNIQDAINKGRGVVISGEKNINASLIAEDVVEIRAIYADGLASQYMLSEMFGVCQTTIGSAILRKTWRHIQ